MQIPIQITKKSLLAMLTAKIGEKEARKLVYGSNTYQYERLTRSRRVQNVVRPRRVHKKMLMTAIGRSQNLKDIRLLYFFGCDLDCWQQCILKNNRGVYVLKELTPTKTR